MSKFDHDIETFLDTPASALRMDGGFEGASRLDRSVSTWFPSMGSADADILPDKPLIDSRSRDVLRNDAYVQSAATIRKDSIVGGMYMLNSRPNTRVLNDPRFDEVWAAEYQAEVEEKFTLYAESPQCYIDARRQMTFTDIIRMSVGMEVLAGEFLGTAEWIRAAGRPFSTAIQIVAVDRLSTPWGQTEGPRLRGGIRKDYWGAPIGYYIRRGHPGDIFSLPQDWEWKYVPARKPWGRVQVIHAFDMAEPEQTRGISDLVACLKETRMGKRYRDVVLQSAVLNATYAATLESDMPTEALYNAMGAGDNNTPGAAAVDYARHYLTGLQEYVGNSKNLKLDGVRIPHLFPGTKLNMQPVSKDAAMGSEFEQSLIRYTAANLGVSAEELSRDYRRANYSSIKAGMASTRRTMLSKKRRGADRVGTHIFRLWLEEAINKGEIQSMPRNAPNMYEGQNMDAYANCEWIGASLGQIDELKETQAAVLRMKSGISTQEIEAAKLGKDWRQINAQAERERIDQESRGLPYTAGDSNMMNAASGAADEPDDDDQDAEAA